jgi:serine/threonine protein kinase
MLLSCISSSVHSLGHLLPTSIKLRMAKECCAGVMYLHSKSIMHCDIKSLNFLGALTLTHLQSFCIYFTRVVFMYLYFTVCYTSFSNVFFFLKLFLLCTPSPWYSKVTSNLTIKLADLGEARVFNGSDPRKLPRYFIVTFVV